MSCAVHIAATGPVEGGCLAREHAGEAPRAPKLIDVVRDTLRARHYSRRTERAYIGWIRRYILFHGKRHPRELGAAEATRFLTALAVDAKVSGSTQNQALAALLFLYREVVRGAVAIAAGVGALAGRRRARVAGGAWRRGRDRDPAGAPDAS